MYWSWQQVDSKFKNVKSAQFFLSKGGKIQTNRQTNIRLPCISVPLFVASCTQLTFVFSVPSHLIFIVQFLFPIIVFCCIATSSAASSSLPPFNVFLCSWHYALLPLPRLKFYIPLFTFFFLFIFSFYFSPLFLSPQHPLQHPFSMIIMCLITFLSNLLVIFVIIRGRLLLGEEKHVVSIIWFANLRLNTVLMFLFSCV